MGRKLTGFLVGTAATLILLAGCDNKNREAITNHTGTQIRDIQKGDTLWKYATELKGENPQLSEMYPGYIVAYLAEFNNMEDPNNIKAGKKILLPIYSNQ